MIDFDEIVEATITDIREVLRTKAKEYSDNDNRFHNFDVAAKMNNTSPEKALYGMMLKHQVSVFDMVNHSDRLYDDSYIDEKIGDHINYLILLKGLLKRHSE